MLKFFKYIIFLLSIVEIQLNGNCKGSANSIDECLEKISEEEKDYDYHCCLFTGKRKDTTIQDSQCLLLDDQEYNSIGDVEDSYQYQYDDPSIDCKSRYLNLSLLLIFVIFI